MSLSFHLGRKLLLSFAAMGTGLLSGMVLYRLQLQSLGAARMGTWVAISSVCASLSLLELGLGSALNREVATVSFAPDAAPRPTGAEPERLPRAVEVLLATALRLYLGVAVLALLGGLLLSALLGPLLRVAPSLRAETRYLPALLSLDVAVTLLCGALRGIINGRGRSEVTSMLTLLRHLTYSALSVLALHRGVGLQGLSLLMLSVDVAAGLLLLGAVRSVGLSLRRALRAAPARAAARTLLGFSSVVTLAYGGQLLLRQAAVPLLARHLGPEGVVGYAAAGRLALVFFMLMTHTGSVLTPLLAGALARGALDARRSLCSAARLGLAVGAPPLLVLLCLAGPLLRAWLGPGRVAAQDVQVLHLMGLGMLAQLVGLGTDVSHYASGGQLRYGAAKLGAGLLALVAITLGARLGAAPGAALGNALVVVLCDAVLTPLLVCRALAALPLRTYYGALWHRAPALLWLIPLGVLLRRAGGACTSLSQLLPLAFLGTLSGWAVLYHGYLDRSERALLRGRAAAAPAALSLCDEETSDAHGL